jgi:hypothetical protein
MSSSTTNGVNGHGHRRRLLSGSTDIILVFPAVQRAQVNVVLSRRITIQAPSTAADDADDNIMNWCEVDVVEDTAERNPVSNVLHQSSTTASPSAYRGPNNSLERTFYSFTDLTFTRAGRWVLRFTTSRLDDSGAIVTGIVYSSPIEVVDESVAAESECKSPLPLLISSEQ